MENQKKKSLKGLWIALALIVVAGIAVWCGINAEIGLDKKTGLPTLNVFGLSSALLAGLFIVVALGYMLGRITIKGVNLGTAGVFLVAILFGYLCTLIPSNIPVLNALRLEAGKGNTTYYKRLVYMSCKCIGYGHYSRLSYSYLCRAAH